MKAVNINHGINTLNQPKPLK